MKKGGKGGMVLKPVERNGCCHGQEGRAVEVMVLWHQVACSHSEQQQRSSRLASSSEGREWRGRSQESLRLVTSEAPLASHVCGTWLSCSETTPGSWTRRCQSLWQSAPSRSCLDTGTHGRSTPRFSAGPS